MVVEVIDCDRRQIRHLPKAQVYLLDRRLLPGRPLCARVAELLVQLAEFVDMLSDALKLLGMQLPTHLGPRKGFKFCGIIYRKHRIAFRLLQKVRDLF
jgi:hypothetical protein